MSSYPEVDFFGIMSNVEDFDSLVDYDLNQLLGIDLDSDSLLNTSNEDYISTDSSSTLAMTAAAQNFCGNEFLSSTARDRTPTPETGKVPVYSPMTPPSSVSPCGIILSPEASASNPEESITLVISPQECNGLQVPRKGKRGRKPKSDSCETGSSSTSKRGKKRKVYEIENPFDAEEMERKRQLAIKAKKYRDQQKMGMKELQQKLEIVEAERDDLKTELETLKTNDPDIERDRLKKEIEILQKENAEWRMKLENEKKHWQDVTSSVVKMLQNSSSI